MRKFYVTLLASLFFVFVATSANAQVTVAVDNPANTTPNLSASYTSLANAITALNGITAISGPVTLTCAAGVETAPAGGYTISFTAATTSTNTVTLIGTGVTITAPAQTAGNLNDAIFKIIGSDYITLQGFTMLENPANTITAAGTNNMTEWGVAVLYATTTNGSQNIIIQNNTIDLDRTYQNTFGIYVNATHTAAAISTSATATGANGGNHGLKIYGNTITDINNGIVVVGPTAAADNNNGIDIGGAGGSQANTITNFGTTGTFSAYANVSGTVNGILVRNSINVNISFNTVTSSAGGTTAGTLNGIQIPASSNAPTITFTNTINNNNISLQSAVATGAINGINYPSGSASATSTLNVSNNNFNTFGHTIAAASGAIIFISIASANQFTTINNNSFTNISVNTTGSVTFISQSFSAPATGSKNTNNNSIVTGFTKTGAGGTVIFITDNGSTAAGAISNCQNNNFSNVTLTGGTAITGINYTDGGTAPTRTVTGNILNNWTTGAATINAMNFTYWNGTSSLSSNTITNITGQGSITGITIGSSINTATSVTISSNTITGLSSTGTGGSVTGITCSNTSALINISNNNINGLSSSGASSTVSGVTVSAATTTNVSSNTINTLSGSGTSSPLINGISISGGTAVNAFKNKIYDLSESGAISTTTPAINGILLSSGVTVTAYNNLIGDLRTPAANLTDAIRGISVTSTATSATYNVYYNSVYLNATSTGTNFGVTGVFHATNATATTAALNLRNNIIVNLSTANGTGFIVAYRRSSTTLANYATTSNNNLFYSGATASPNFIFHDGTTGYQLAAFKTLVAPRESASVTENPNFLSTAGSNANFLHINSAIATQIESSAVNISGITDDFDAQVRQGNPGYPGSGTAPDMGADEFNGIAADLTPPAINYSLLTNTLCTTNRILSGVTITDGSGVNTTAGTKPRLYYQKSTETNDLAGWHYVEANGTTSPFDFTIDYSVLPGGTVVSGDVIRYFVAAQDNAASPNVGIYNGSFNAQPSSVALTASAFPIGGTINSYNVLTSLNASITIGAGRDYPTLTGTGGLFEALNNAGLNVPATATIMDAAIVETGTVSLNQITYGCAGTQLLTIKPNAGLAVVLSGTNATALINLNGADNVTIDGLNTGGASLSIRNTNTAGATIRLINDATNNTITNSIIEGNATSTTSGVILFSTTTGTAGNSNNAISNCIVRDRSDAAGVPANAIFSSGTAGALNANNTVTGSNIFNWTNAGVSVSSAGAGNGWVISSNKLYQTANRTTSLTAISVQGGSGQSIINNSIGGSAADRSGNPLATTGVFSGIALSVGTSSATSVQGNIISNLNISGGSTQTWQGINISGGNVNVGNITGNTIGGGAAVYDTIRTNYDSRAIYNTGSGIVDIENNTVGNISYYNASNDELRGISVLAGTTTIRNNIVRDMKSNATAATSFFINGINLGTSTSNNLVEGNQVYNLRQFNTTGGNIFAIGIVVSGATSSEVRKNKVYNIDADLASLLYGVYSISGSATYSNNMVALNPSGQNHTVVGFRDDGTGVNNYYFNSVSVTGSVTSGAANTYAFWRNGSATVDIRNNIFSNTRTGGTGFHVAIANLNASATGWPATASNYNDLYSATSTTVAQWLGSAAANNRDLSGWQASQAAGTPGSGGDANSVSIVPIFTTATDLHLTGANAGLNNLGTPIAGITTDIDGDIRSVTTPDMGADEFSVTACAGAIGGVASGSVAFCVSGTPAITATGYSAGVGSAYQWEFSNDNFVVDIHDFVGQTSPAALTTGVVSSTTYYRLRVSCTTGTATAYSNIITVTVNSNPTVTITPGGTQSACAPGGVNFSVNATSASSPAYQWLLNGSNILSATSSTYNAVASGNYSLKITDGTTSCSATSAVTVVTINPQPTAITITPAAATICSNGAAQLFTASGSTVAGTILTENFDAVTAGTTTSGNLPAGWSGASLTSGVRIWGVVANAQSGSTLGSGNFLYCESDQYTSFQTRSEVLTPVFDASSYSSINIKFKQYYNDLTSGSATDSARVYVSNDGGTNWTLVQQYDADNGTAFSGAGSVNTTIAVPGTISLTNNMRVKLVYNSDAGGNDWYWAVDDFVIDGPQNPNYTWTPVTGLYTNPAATTPYAGGPSATVYALPASTATYTATATSGSGCTNSNTATITVTPAATVSAGSNQAICSNTTATLNGSFGGGATSATWTTSGTGTFNDATLINAVYTPGPADIAAGSVTLTLTTNDPAGPCNAANASMTLNITTAPSASIAYTGSPYCSNGGTVNVTFSGTTGGSYSSTSGLSINATTGAINLNASTAGTYTITYTIAANGGCAQYTTTASITITAMPTATISYAGSPYCSNAGTANVTFSGTTGGSYTSTAGLSINAATGAINLGASTAGTYTVTYTVTANGGCAQFTTTASITITAAPTATISYAGSPYCSDAGTASVSFSGTTGGVYTSTTGLSINAATGAINLGASTAGTYTVTYTVAASGGCAQFTTTANITVNAAATVSAGVNQTICSGGSANLNGSIGGGAASATWSSSGTGTFDNAALLNAVYTPGAADVTAGSVVLTLTTNDPAGPCAAASANITLTLVTAPSATISYAGSPYCSNVGTASVTQTGTTGGTYSSTSGLSINATTGAINPGASTAGTYTVTYAIAATGTCPAFSTTASVTITAAPSATISYTGSPYCSNAGTASVTQTGTTGGSYSSTAGLSINASTGAINPATSTAGTYTVTYTIAASGGCSQFTTTASVTITAAPSATISYSGSPYCSNGGTATATQTGTTGGTYSSTAGLSINASTGAINPATSTAGTYTVTYTIAASGGCSQFTTTASVTITAAPSATISYSGSPYCSNAGTAAVTQTGTTGGSYSSTAGLSINASTGAINPATSTAGIYTVTYTIAASGGCSQFTTTASVTITAAPSATISYAGSPYCSNAGTANVTLTGTIGGSYSSTAGLSINASTGAINIGASTTGTYTVTYTIAASGGCSQFTTTASVTITAAPSATISYAGSPYCSNAGTATVTQTGTTGGSYSSTTGLSINASTGAINPATSTAGTYTVTYTIAASGGCSQFTTTASVTITAAPSATISYAGSPYCSNAGTANVTQTGTTGGTYSSTAGLSINTSTGAVNPGASTAGTYTVTYTIAASGGCSQFTTTASVTITAAPSATISYAGSPYCAGAGTANVTQAGTTGGSYSSTAGLSINASTGAINLSASTAGTYTVTYTVAASGGCSQFTTTTSITINATANITAQPTGGTKCVGDNVTFSVTASGATTYQWRKNGTNITGATSSTYSINNLATTDAGNYDVVIGNAANCSVTSSVAVLVVNAATNANGLSGTAGGAQVCQNIAVAAAGTLYFDNNCNLILKILPSGATPVTGTINDCVKIENTIPTSAGQPYVVRHFDATPATNPSTSTATVTLYVTQAEFDIYNTYLANNPAAFNELPANSTASTATVRVRQYHGSFVGPTLFDYSGANELLTPASVTWNAAKNWWEITVNVTGFSGFFITSTPWITGLPQTPGRPDVITVTSLFPNPTHRDVYVKIQSPRHDKVRYIITDANGKLVYSKEGIIEAGENIVPFNVVGFANGMYLVRIVSQSNLGTTVTKFVKH